MVLLIKYRITSKIARGTLSRLAVGLIIFTHVIAYNESGAITVLFSALIATICATFSGNQFIVALKTRHLIPFDGSLAKATKMPSMRFNSSHCNVRSTANGKNETVFVPNRTFSFVKSIGEIERHSQYK